MANPVRSPAHSPVTRRFYEGSEVKFSVKNQKAREHSSQEELHESLWTQLLSNFQQNCAFHLKRY